MKCYLTICHGGRGVITFLPPIISKIRGTRPPIDDAFERVGEPLSIKHLCEAGMKTALREHGQVLGPPLKPRRVELTLRYIDEATE